MRICRLAAGALLLLVPGVVAQVWRQVTVGFGFEVHAAADGLRLRHGLLEHAQQTLPPGRVQAVQVDQPPTWRAAGWWQLTMNVAGYVGQDGAEHSETVLLPAGTRDDVMRVLTLLWPGLLADPAAAALVDAGLTGDAGRGPQPADGGFVGVPARALLLDPLGGRRAGVAATDQVLLVRRGVWHRRLVLVPHGRTQGLGVAQGPLQRRLGLATVQVHSTPGPVRVVVPHLTTADAARLMRGQGLRAASARRLAGPERWIGGDLLLEPAEPAQTRRVEQLGEA